MRDVLRVGDEDIEKAALEFPRYGQRLDTA